MMTGGGGLDLLHWTVHPSEALARRLFDTVLGTCELTILAARLRAASPQGRGDVRKPQPANSCAAGANEDQKLRPPTE